MSASLLPTCTIAFDQDSYDGRKIIFFQSLKVGTPQPHGVREHVSILEIFFVFMNNVKEERELERPIPYITVKPNTIDTITARTDPKTDIAPLMPYIQGMRRSWLFPCDSSRQERNGTPIKKALGRIMRTQTKERSMIPHSKQYDNMIGNAINRMMLAKTTEALARDNRRLISAGKSFFSEHLSIPIPTRRVEPFCWMDDQPLSVESMNRCLRSLIPGQQEKG
jgi:hypothetical protein